MVEANIIQGDCIKELKKLKSKSIRLAVTSPPYNLKKDYLLYIDDVHIDEWKKLISATFKELKRVLTPDGSFFLNVSPIPDKKTKEIIPLDSIAWGIGKKNGFFLRNKIIWHFNNMQNPTKRLAGRWEAVLWFVKDINNYVFNLKDVKIPVITQNDKRFDASSGRNPTDVWFFNRVNNMTKKKLGITEHPCIYPVDMIERIIKMSSNKGDWVLDPFVGSGTTLLAAKKLGRNSIGIDLDKKYCEMTRNRLKKESNLKDFM
ncbi:site-specific DNA-methyltransferase [Candidatus Woesearchaeota archaeon]|nr:site-specific DNA-methyltransferase [Candidatus Woesearchaeota archaeon]